MSKQPMTGPNATTLAQAKQGDVKAIAQFYEVERIEFPRDDEGNLTDDFKQFFENQVEWHIL